LPDLPALTDLRQGDGIKSLHVLTKQSSASEERKALPAKENLPKINADYINRVSQTCKEELEIT